jgi:hypothetical protein
MNHSVNFVGFAEADRFSSTVGFSLPSLKRSPAPSVIGGTHINEVVVGSPITRSAWGCSRRRPDIDFHAKGASSRKTVCSDPQNPCAFGYKLKADIRVVTNSADRRSGPGYRSIYFDTVNRS